MEKIYNVLNIISDMFSCILEIKLVELPQLIALIGVSGMVGYCVSMFLVGFPCSVWEAITKKKINEDIQNKIICIFAICLSIAFILRVIYERIY